MNSRIVVSGMGFITPLGNELNEVWEALLQKKSASKKWIDLEKQGFQNSVACRIVGYHSGSYQRGKELAIQAVKNAVLQAGITLPEKSTGVFVGSTLGESLIFEKYAEGEPLNPEKFTCASYADEIKRYFNLNSVSRAYGTACSAGNYAISSGAGLLKKGIIDVAIAGGVDPFSRIAMAGFSRSRAMSSDGICRPFDINRNGMLLSEGAAFMILEREEDTIKRNANPLAVIGEIGITCDAYHPTSSNPDGVQIKTAMYRALQQQNIKPESVDMICAHGSGTIISDKAEAKGIHQIFGKLSTPVCGIKGALGHSLGAATAIEAIISILSIEKQTIPPTTNYNEPDDELDLNVVYKPSRTRINWVLNCGYAFGGLNTALLLGKLN